MIEPALSDDAFLADVQAVPADENRIDLWWLGQSGFLIKWFGHLVLVDPYLSDSLTQKYAQTDRPHVRMSRRVVDPARLGAVRIITSSHNHSDHLDAESIVPILKQNPKLNLIAPVANHEEVSKRLGVDRMKLLIVGEQQFHGPFWGMHIVSVPSAHDTVDRDANGDCRCVGYVFRMGKHHIYHSGDTVLYKGLAERLKQLNVDIAILPINGRLPERKIAGNLSGKEAAALAKEIGAKVVIPCHYDMFEFNTASPDEFVAECKRLNQPYRVLEQGERWSSLELSQ